MILISEKSALALIEAARNVPNANKTLLEACAMVQKKLDEPQVKPHAQIENLRLIKDLALAGLTSNVSEAIPTLKEILRCVNCAIGGKLYAPSDATPEQKKAARAGKRAVTPC